MDSVLRIERMGEGDVERVLAAGHIFDDPPTAERTTDMLRRSGHHLLIAFSGGEPAGFVTGIEIAHPDKAVEMLVYELGVEDAFQRRGIATALLRSLEEVIRSLGGNELWVPTEPDNDAACATYRSIGAEPEESVIFTWRG